MQRLKATEPELRRRGVAHLSVFGSLVRGEARHDSDIDIAVEIESGRSFSLIRMEDRAFAVFAPKAVNCLGTEAGDLFAVFAGAGRSPGVEWAINRSFRRPARCHGIVPPRPAAGYVAPGGP